MYGVQFAPKGPQEGFDAPSRSPDLPLRVSRCWLRPSRCIVNISFNPARVEEKMILLPSGLKCGFSLVPTSVSTLKSFPVGVIVQMSKRPRSVRLTKAIRSPLGDQTGLSL